MKSVSIVIPLLNEQDYIVNLIESISHQSYPHSLMDIYFVDGNSSDQTVELIHQTMKHVDIDYTVLSNPLKKTPISVNLGIKASKKDIIIRLDGHSHYDPLYVELCVRYLEETDAKNVGCLVRTESKGLVGNAIASVLSSRFGVGNSDFRTNAQSGYVDTVPFGCFYRSLFNEIGYFNEDLLRSEDNEFNGRIRKSGGKIYLFTDIYTIYYPRNTLKKLLKMAYANGKEIIVSGIKYPGTMRLRHLIPLLFTLSLMGGSFICLLRIPYLPYLFLLELFAYFSLDFIFSFIKSKNTFISRCLEFIIYPLFHIFYGLGSIVGILTMKKEHTL